MSEVAAYVKDKKRWKLKLVMRMMWRTCGESKDWIGANYNITQMNPVDYQIGTDHA
jgi:hypothetical protein